MHCQVLVLYSIPSILIPKLLGIVSKWKLLVSPTTTQICISLMSIELTPTNERSSNVCQGNPEWKHNKNIAESMRNTKTQHVSYDNMETCHICVIFLRILPIFCHIYVLRGFPWCTSGNLSFLLVIVPLHLAFHHI